jgi:pimeloyl-ACP methyl ester carboxylesterase
MIGVNGCEIHHDVRGEGTPLLLLHGFTGSGRDWRHVFPEPLAGFQFIEADLRGHGRSTNPSGVFTFRQAAADMLGVLDALGLDRVSAVGMSGGAKTLLHMATAQPSRIDRLVLVSAAPYFPASARPLFASLSLDAATEAEWTRLRQTHVHGDDQIRAIYAQGRGLSASYDDMNFTPSLLSTITAQTLLVHGDRDPFYPVKLAVEMYEAIPNARLWIVPNAGHGPIFGPLAPPFVQTVRGFLSEPAAPRPH